MAEIKSNQPDANSRNSITNENIAKKEPESNNKNYSQNKYFIEPEKEVENNKSFFISIIPKSKEINRSNKNLSINKAGIISRNGNTLEYSDYLPINNTNEESKKNYSPINDLNNIFNYTKLNKTNNVRFNLIYETVEEDVRNKLKKDKNLSFCSVGENIKDNFFFGATNYFTHDSFFIKMLNLTVKVLKEEEKFDIILIDFIKFHKEKFLLDYVS
jgi:hypothetical protein